MFGENAQLPSDLSEIKTLLTQYTKTNKTGDRALVSAFRQLDIAQSADNPISVHQAITRGLEDFHRQVKGYSVDISKDFNDAQVTVSDVLGKGGLGTASRATIDGKQKVLKNITAPYPILLDTEASNRKGEAVLLRSPEVAAAFLRSSESEVVVVPSHYLVEEKIGSQVKTHLVEVRDKEFRAWAKDQLLKNAGTVNYSLNIVGEVQDLASGEEVQKKLFWDPD